jgi:hypothetical protein
MKPLEASLVTPLLVRDRRYLEQASAGRMLRPDARDILSLPLHDSSNPKPGGPLDQADARAAFRWPRPLTR